jgi:hypothetical protein
MPTVILSRPVYTVAAAVDLPVLPGKRMTGPLISGVAAGGVFGLWNVGCTE